MVVNAQQRIISPRLSPRTEKHNSRISWIPDCCVEERMSDRTQYHSWSFLFMSDFNGSNGSGSGDCGRSARHAESLLGALCFFDGEYDRRNETYYCFLHRTVICCHAESADHLWFRWVWIRGGMPFAWREKGRLRDMHSLLWPGRILKWNSAQASCTAIRRNSFSMQ